MHKAPEGCLSAMGTEFLVCGRYKDRFPSGFELEFWSHRLVSTDRVVFRLAFLHNTNSFQTVIFSATELLRLRSKSYEQGRANWVRGAEGEYREADERDSGTAREGVARGVHNGRPLAHRTGDRQRSGMEDKETTFASVLGRQPPVKLRLQSVLVVVCFGALGLLIIAIALPIFVRARIGIGVGNVACLDNLLRIDTAKQIWARENRKGP